MLGFAKPAPFICSKRMFLLQLIGSDKRISVILHSMHSIVDYYTIPAVIISVVLNRYFTGKFEFLADLSPLM